MEWILSVITSIGCRINIEAEPGLEMTGSCLLDYQESLSSISAGSVVGIWIYGHHNGYAVDCVWSKDHGIYTGKMQIICILIYVLVALDGYEWIAEAMGSREWIFIVLRREKCDWHYGSLHSVWLQILHGTFQISSVTFGIWSGYGLYRIINTQCHWNKQPLPEWTCSIRKQPKYRTVMISQTCLTMFVLK